jgi:hypothetical protein
MNRPKINWFIKTFGLKGSWKWAKRKMMQGKIVRCKHWSGALRLKIDNSDNTLLQSSFWGKELASQDNVNGKHKEEWETSNHHLSYEDFTDYEISIGYK